MAYFTKEFINYFKDLNKNNNRDWFHANKKRYEANAKEPFKELVADLIKKLKLDLEPKNAIFRINRDIRFSKDKTPYKTQVSAILTPGGRKQKDHPGYYLALSHGSLMIGGGAYFLEKDDLYAVRQHIMNNPKAFAKLIKKKAFVDKYEAIQGDKNKRIPKEFVEAHEAQPLIANKQFYFMSEHDLKNILKDDLLKYIMDHFKAGADLNQFLIDAMGK